MKLLRTELGQDYGTYTFGYANYCVREEGDALGGIYAAGYLPYTGARDVKDTFYMARSARVLLRRWQATSENRRIAKKFDGRFERERVPADDFRADESFYEFCLSYFAQKHGERAMPKERLLHILSVGLISTVVIYREAGRVVAYALEAEAGDSAHYWYSFYDLSYARQSLGLWLMFDSVRDAKARGLLYYYLGTVYGEKALYKTNFEPLEWWDGSRWSDDVALLKERGRQDAGRGVLFADRLKDGQSLF